jgi:hypothetical protein
MEPEKKIIKVRDSVKLVETLAKYGIQNEKNVPSLVRAA